MPILKALLWLIVGTVLGFGIGVLEFRLAADPTDGFADLAAFAGSVFTYAPVGGLIGLALALRKRPWPMPRMAVGGLVLAATPVVFISDSYVTAWGLATYGVLAGAFIVWWLDRRKTGQRVPG